MQGVLCREKWRTWFTECEHTEAGWLEEAWEISDRGEEEAEARVYYKGGGVVRVLVGNGPRRVWLVPGGDTGVCG